MTNIDVIMTFYWFINCGYYLTIQRLSLVPRLCRGKQWVRFRLTSSRMFALFLCACRFWASCVSVGGATQSGLGGGAS